MRMRIGSGSCGKSCVSSIEINQMLKSNFGFVTFEAIVVFMKILFEQIKLHQPTLMKMSSNAMKITTLSFFMK